METKKKKWLLYGIEFLLWLFFLSIPLLFILSGPPKGGHTHAHGLGHKHDMHKHAAHFFHPFSIIIRGLWLIATYYLSYYYLVPKLYFKKRQVKYLIVCLIIFLIPNGFSLGIDFFREGHLKFPPPAMVQFFMSLLVLLVPLGIRIYKQWIEAEKEKTIAELSFLKSQINHHFLFNSLNNIYSLSIQENKSTPKAIHSLSFIMRYILDEVVKQQTPLAKELEYMHHYISLQRLRMSEKATLLYDVKGDAGEYTISPMLLIPFVENCFKHGLSTIEACEIDINIEIANDEIVLRTKNKIFNQTDHGNIESGIGIKNVIKRLEMDYPNNYFLLNEEKDAYYYVELKIRLV